MYPEHFAEAAEAEGPTLVELLRLVHLHPPHPGLQPADERAADEERGAEFSLGEARVLPPPVAHVRLLGLHLFRVNDGLATLGMHRSYSEWNEWIMTTTERRKAVAGRVREAEELVVRLRGGFAGVGIVLPSLRIDPLSFAGDEPVALLDLGRCNLDTALRLTQVLEEKRAGRDG